MKALWNVLSDVGRKVAVVGWWATWPAETVNGTIVSDHTAYHFLFREGQTGAKNPIGTVHPPELQEVVDRMVRRPTSLTASDLAPFVNMSEEEFEQPFAFDDPLGHFKWALATAESYRDIGLHLWKHQEPDALMVYIEGVDSSSHLFGHLFRADGLAGELAAQQQRYGGTVEAMYRYADEIVGEYMQAMDDETTLIVLSDHGFRLGALHDDPSKTRDMRRVSEKFHEIEGILYLYGQHIRPGSPDRSAQRYSMSRRRSWRCWASLPLSTCPAGFWRKRWICRYRNGRWPASRVAGRPKAMRCATRGSTPPSSNDSNSSAISTPSSPSADRNLAGSLFEAGRLEEASEVYARLVAENPKDGALRASYGGVLGSLERYDEALEQLDRAIALKPLNAEAYHNRGLIHERRGDVQAAIVQYRSALRYRPGYPPSAQSLARLSAPADPSAPQTPAQKLASLMIERASEAARRGDYASAMAQLDEAQRIAPRYPLVYQYRSNVAFLMGDHKAAIQALRKAIELEPDNDLFRVNLERLQRKSGS